MATARVVRPTMHQFVTFFFVLITGLIAGFIASVLTGRKGLGILGYIVVGVVGSIVGHLIFQLIVKFPFIPELVLATAGSVLLLTLAGYVFKDTSRK